MRVVRGTEVNGVTIFIQVPDRAEIVEEPQAGGDGELLGADGKIADRMKTVGEAISGVCATIYSSVHEAIDTTRPDEITLEFGIKLGGKTGIPFVTEGSAEGSFKVTAKWKSISKDASPKADEAEADDASGGDE